MERFDRILEIDAENLLAVVQPNVITHELQDAVEARGLFYPPDPASLKQSSLGGNVAECAGGPRAVKYGTTKRYVLALEAVLPTGEIVRTGSKAVKNVVGYDLTQLLVGSEGTLAIVTEITLRLVPKPAVQATLQATFASIGDAVAAVTGLLAARVVPATIELIDRESLDAVERHLARSLAPEGTGAMLIIEVDGVPGGVDEEAARVDRRVPRGRRPRRPPRIHRRRTRRHLGSPPRAVVRASRDRAAQDQPRPRGAARPRAATLRSGRRVRREHQLLIPCFGHAGDGNIHINLMVDPANPDEMRRAMLAERQLFEGVVQLEGSISGEHGIGFSKAQIPRTRAVTADHRLDAADQTRLRPARGAQSRQAVGSGGGNEERRTKNEELERETQNEERKWRERARIASCASRLHPSS